MSWKKRYKEGEVKRTESRASRSDREGRKKGIKEYENDI